MIHAIWLRPLPACLSPCLPRSVCPPTPPCPTLPHNPLSCSTSLHYIRCLKPNSQQVAGRFDASLVLHQLRCCGVLEVARIAAAGYPTRYLHAEFAARYRELLPELGSGVWCVQGLAGGLAPCLLVGIVRQWACMAAGLCCRVASLTAADRCAATQRFTPCSRPAACWSGRLGCVQAPADALLHRALPVPDWQEQAVLQGGGPGPAGGRCGAHAEVGRRVGGSLSSPARLPDCTRCWSGCAVLRPWHAPLPGY